MERGHAALAYDQLCNRNVVMMMKFSSARALEVVMLTTFSVTYEENFVNMTAFRHSECRAINFTVNHIAYETKL